MSWTSITLAPSDGGTHLCGCETPLRFEDWTSPEGFLTHTFRKLGGRGSIDVLVGSHTFGDFEIARAPVQFTSPDLDASCGASESVGVVDPGIRASELSHPAPSFGDYNRDGTVDIT